MSRLVFYLARLDGPRTILWCYLLWYLVVLVERFDPSPRLWLTSLGLAVIIGFALLLNAGLGRTGAPSIERWQAFRFFLMPFCVSSFSALVKGKGFVLIVSPVPREVVAGVAAIVVFLGLRTGARRLLARAPGDVTGRESTRWSE